MTERPARGELGWTPGRLRDELERPLRRRAGVLGAPALCVDETLDREVVGERHRLPGLPRQLLALEGVSQGGFESPIVASTKPSRMRT